MADITMCVDYDCPSADKCYRVLAVPTPLYQSYGNFQRAKVADQCHEFIPVTKGD
jgi:hypothetical protein